MSTTPTIAPTATPAVTATFAATSTSTPDWLAALNAAAAENDPSQGRLPGEDAVSYMVRGVLSIEAPLGQVAEQLGTRPDVMAVAIQSATGLHPKVLRSERGWGRKTSPATHAARAAAALAASTTTAPGETGETGERGSLSATGSSAQAYVDPRATEMVRLYVAGTSLLEVGRHFEVSEGRVGQIIRAATGLTEGQVRVRHGWLTPRFSPEAVAHIQQLAIADPTASVRDLATQSSTTTLRVTLALQAHNPPLERPARRSASRLPVEELVHLYVEEGLTTVELAPRYGVTPSSIGRRLRSAGIVLRGRGSTAKQ